MLLNLTITNFAIIDRLEIQFDDGFNVLTGETGAGKSIILDAVGLLLGDRARPDLVRSGANEATVEALFDLSGQEPVKRDFIDAGFAVDDELVLRRVVQSGGRSRAYVNGSLVTLAQLQPLAEQLVTVCGQHEHHSLLQRNVHLEILDRFGSIDDKANEYRTSYRSMKSVAEQLEQLRNADRDRKQRLDLLRHQSVEIAAAGLDPEEEDALIKERVVLHNAERLASVTQQSYERLYGESGAVSEILGQVAEELGAVANVDNELEGLAETVRRNLFEMEDVAADLRSYLGRISHDSERLPVVDDRLDQINRLKRKYAPAVSAILEYKEQIDREIETLDNAGTRMDQLEADFREMNDKTLRLGKKLTKARAVAATNLSTVLVDELNELAMSGASFDVAFSALDEPGADGLERVEFFVSLNPGEPLMPLAKVASGGELSRLMLAIKRIAPDAENVPTVIFDEVDAGIGGVAATAVGRKLQTVSQSLQILCVTHLPQVAAFADHHYRVVKFEHEGRTLATMEPVADDIRVDELARMLGGATVTDKSHGHARELLDVSSR